MPTSDISNKKQDFRKSDRSFDPQTVVLKKVRQKTSSENSLKTPFIFLLVLWMLVAVILPVYQLIDRSMHAEVLVSIWGNDDVRIGGRRVYIDGKTLLVNIDKKTFPLTNTIVSHDGITVDIGDKNIPRHLYQSDELCGTG